MKINLNEIDIGNFLVKTDIVAKEEVFLIYPTHIGTKWNKSNLIFRSSIWNKEGEPVSLSLKKFYNWLEQPDLAYTPFSTTANGGINVLTKEDGSCLIVSKYKGELICRTRGTFDARGLDNGFEIDLLIEKYPKVFDLPTNEEDTCDYSLIFEWVTPNNVIVYKYDELDIILLNKIHHKDYSMETQANLDKLALELGVKRPKVHKFDSIKELLENVNLWEGTEGVCVYSKHDQEIRKIKAEKYLVLHRMKSELGSFGRVVDVFIEFGCPKYQDFNNLLAEVYDWEIVNAARNHISIICDGWKEVEKILDGMKSFVEGIKGLTTRKEQAKLVLEAYGGKKNNRSGMVFKILDNKQLDKEDFKKLLFQKIKQPN